MCIVDVIRQLAKEKGMSLTVLEQTVGLGNGTIGKWTKQSPSCDKLKLVADYLSTSIDYLLTGEEKSPSLPEDELELLTYYKALPELEKIRLVSRAETLADVYAEKALLEAEKPAIEMTCSEEPETIKLKYFDDAASAGTGVELGEGSYTDLTVTPNAFTAKADMVIRVKGNSMQPQFCDGDLVLVRLTPSVEVGEIGIFRIDSEKGYIKKKGADRLISLNPDYDDIPYSEEKEIDTIGRVLGILKPEWIIVL